MEKICDKKFCVGCGACNSICPVKCISMREDMEGFFYPEIDTKRCKNCGACVSVCPGRRQENVKVEAKFLTKALSAQNKSTDERMMSSSGGVISLMAKNIITEGGIVFGAAFSSDCRKVQHIEISKLEDIGKIRGSKYIQSEIGGCYEAIKKHLDKGKKVLFIGTPCQVAGLRFFLKREYQNLILVDFVCHGVPSPSVWREHIMEVEKQNQAQIISVNFRLKEPEWRDYSIKYSFSDSKQITRSCRKDMFIIGYLSNLYLRESCEVCRYKGENRYSDITVADHWGVWDIAKEMDDKKGTSLLVIHTEKGRNLLEKIKPDIRFIVTDLDKAIQYNLSYVNQATASKYRRWFFRSFRRRGYSRTMRYFSIIRIFERIKNRFHL